jgi:serine/threonine protein kinase
MVVEDGGSGVVINPSSEPTTPSRQEIKARLTTAVAKCPPPPIAAQRIGPYVIQDAVGQGEFGTIWRARKLAGDTLVAIKIFRWERFEDPNVRVEAAERFYFGARSMGELSTSERVVRLIEGPMIADEGLIWFAMQYFERRDLGIALRKHEISWEGRIRIVDQLIEAVSAAHHHQFQIVHRDIRPANILVKTSGDSPDVALGDFDLSFFDHVLETDRTQKLPWAVIRYFPGEIFRDDVTRQKAMLRDPRNDLYALSVVIYEIFAGMGGKLFENEEDLLKVLRANLRRSETPTSIPSHMATRVARLARRGFSGTPSERFQTIDEFRGFWQNAASSARSLKIAGHAILFSTTLLLLAVPEALIQSSNLFSGGLLGATVIAYAIVFDAWLKVDLFRALPKKWSRFANLTFRAHRKMLAVSVVFLTSAVLAVVFSKLPSRVRAYRVIGGHGCRCDVGLGCSSLSSDNEVVFRAEPSMTGANQASEPSLSCPSGQPTVERLSILNFVPLHVNATTASTSPIASVSVQASVSAPPRIVPPADCVRIEAARFKVGSAVEEVRRFCLGKTEVAAASYQECSNCPPASLDVQWQGISDGDRQRLSPICWRSLANAYSGQLPKSPINCVSWAAAVAYCQHLGGRLPTRGEWLAASEMFGAWRADWTIPRPPHFFNLCGQECLRYRPDHSQVAEAGGVAWNYMDGWPNLANVDEMSASSPKGLIHLIGNVGEWLDADPAVDFALAAGANWEDRQPLDSSKLMTAHGKETLDSRIGFRCAWSL